MNFGAYKPGSSAGGTGVYSGTGYQAPGVYKRDGDLVEKVRFLPPTFEKEDENDNTALDHPDEMNPGLSAQ